MNCALPGVTFRHQPWRIPLHRRPRLHAVVMQQQPTGRQYLRYRVLSFSSAVKLLAYPVRRRIAFWLVACGRSCSVTAWRTVFTLCLYTIITRTPATLIATYGSVLGFLPLFLTGDASGAFAFSIISSRSFLSNRVLPPILTGVISFRSTIRYSVV